MIGAQHMDISIDGRVDLETSGEMRRKLAEALRSMPPVVTLDFSAVSYVDTSGFATLLEATRIARQQGTRLLLKGLQGQPDALLRLSPVGHLLEHAEQEPNGRPDPRP
jgi:anti-sigma B factor antagonist